MHQCWAKSEAGKMVYCDGAIDDQPEWPHFIDAIREMKAVILTRDHLENGQPKKRNGYVALFAVDDVEVSGSDLRFTFTKRLDDFT